jgi:hypothetical protein
MWDITRPETMASPTDAASVISAIGRYDGAFVKSLTRFNQLLSTGSLDITVPPRPRQLRQGVLEDNAAIVKFWIAASAHADEDVARVGREACVACNIPLSQAVVERSFSVLTNRQRDNTLLAGPRYLRNLMMFSGNRRHLFDLYREPMRNVAAALGVV